MSSVNVAFAGVDIQRFLGLAEHNPVLDPKIGADNTAPNRSLFNDANGKPDFSNNSCPSRTM